jgi:hypothetical protein
MLFASALRQHNGSVPRFITGRRQLVAFYLADAWAKRAGNERARVLTRAPHRCGAKVGLLT